MCSEDSSSPYTLPEAKRSLSFFSPTTISTFFFSTNKYICFWPHLVVLGVTVAWRSVGNPGWGSCISSMQSMCVRPLSFLFGPRIVTFCFIYLFILSHTWWCSGALHESVFRGDPGRLQGQHQLGRPRACQVAYLPNASWGLEEKKRWEAPVERLASNNNDSDLLPALLRTLGMSSLYHQASLYSTA